jgi:hypothetical protein
MVRTYKRSTERGGYGEVKLADALRDIQQGAPLIRVAKEYGIPARTLRRHRDGKVNQPGQVHLGRHAPVLGKDTEKELHDHIKFMEQALYGLTTLDVRRLAFDVAEAAGVSHPFNKETRLAGKDWLSGFFARHPDLSVREPQGTNLSRAVGFNKPKVDQFFDLYEKLLTSHKYKPSDVWNMDETGITNVHKPGKIVATKGARQIGKITSGERGSTVTVICAIVWSEKLFYEIFISLGLEKLVITTINNCAKLECHLTTA